jgi:hypothetical protein
MRRHRWLITLISSRATFGPHGVDLLEHVLRVLEDHPATGEAKLEAFAMLNGVVVLLVQNELAVDPAAQQRQLAYLFHAAGTGRYPRLAQLMTGSPTAPPQPVDRFEQILSRVLTGLLGPQT